MSHNDPHPALQPITTRRISDRAFIGHYAAAVVLGLLVATGCFLVGFGLFAPAGLLPLAWVFAQSRLARLDTEYRLFVDRIEVESGILSRRIENVELFRVRDVSLRQGLFGQLGNFGDVYIHSTDATTPDVTVRGIDAPKEFYQSVRQLVSDSRAQHRTMIVEESMPAMER
jgi:uncharacterized membrane protein YdbT with pleckstrin-like domain